MSSAITFYKKICSEEQVEYNHKQELLIYELDKFLSYKKKSFILKIFDTPSNGKKKCFYIHGGVGIGKTLIMDLFSDSVKNKQRIHFHKFMIEVHDELHSLRSQNKDKEFLIAQLAKKIKDKYEFIFFDEFQVTNIADAMILGHLFIELFKNNVYVILTSNSKPEDLYKDGLQRELFLPFIKILKDNSIIHHLDIDTDYRTKNLNNQETFFIANSSVSSLKIKDIYEKMIEGYTPKDEIISIKKRDFVIRRLANRIAWFQFEQICGGHIGAEDYLEMIKYMDKIIVENVPIFSNANANMQERFINLIDVLYDNQIQTIISSDKAIEKLGSAFYLKDKFQRTVSRLIEMRSN